ncbi:MAG: hypothetical protein KME17_11730 [Cyanosarcina radialis HA8281-LM2]|jgi:hypothetical protein|nr:hypothetical protein [Cyanosarcina radialis HA8281-LM2]
MKKYLSPILLVSVTSLVACQNVSDRPVVEKPTLAVSPALSTPPPDLTALTSPTPTPSPTFSQPEIPLPKSGKVTRVTKKRAIAPLAIDTTAGTNYFLKLVDSASQATVMTVFVRGGTTTRVKVPLGTYQIRYATGDKWYGTKYLFGPDTTYNKAEEIFKFRKEGNRVLGYTLKLYKVVDGNLQTTPIDPGQF